MTKFLTGLAIGLPVGMLIADAITPEERTEMADKMRRIWQDARARAQQLASASENPAGEESGPVLNRVSRDELLAVYGIGPVLANRIIEGRPYTSDYDVVELDILNEATFEQLRRQLLGRRRKSA